MWPLVLQQVYREMGDNRKSDMPVVPCPRDTTSMRFVEKLHVAVQRGAIQQDKNGGLVLPRQVDIGIALDDRHGSSKYN
jgi:hypothetical protein